MYIVTKHLYIKCGWDWCESAYPEIPQKCVFCLKKYVFCTFHVLHLPPPDQTAYIIYVVKVGKKLAKSLTSRKSAHSFFPGKKPDPENPGKIGILNLRHLMSETMNGHQKLELFGVIWMSMCDFREFGQYWHWIFVVYVYIHEFKKKISLIYNFRSINVSNLNKKNFIVRGLAPVCGDIVFLIF